MPSLAKIQDSKKQCSKLDLMACKGKQIVQNVRSDRDRKNMAGEVQWYRMLFLAIITYMVMLLTVIPKIAHRTANVPPT